MTRSDTDHVKSGGAAGSHEGLRRFVHPCVLTGATAVALVLVPRSMRDYDIYVLNLAMINVLLAVGMNVVIGTARQFSLANAALFGLGAYAMTILCQGYGVPFVFATVIAMLSASAISAAISLIAWRVSGIYLAMITFAFSEMFVFLATHAGKITNGPDGLKVARPQILGHVFEKHQDIFQMVLVVTVVALIMWRQVERGIVGRRLRAVGDSAVALSATGIEPRGMITLAFAIQGLFAGLAGSLFAATVGFIDPTSFGLPDTIHMLAAIAIGGLGSLPGSIIGALTLTGLDRALVDFPGVREFVFGATLLLIFLGLPGGIVSLVQKAGLPKR